jgi:hypothetical protein
MPWMIASQASAAEWPDMVKLYGDLRYRYESIQDETGSVKLGNGYNYNERNRLRARVGALIQPDDYWTGNFRLTTDETKDPVSANQTEGADFTKKEIDLDVMSVEYKILFNNAKLTAGKMLNPFVTVGNSELIWDADLTLEGAAANFNVDVVPETNLFLNGGAFWVAQVKNGNSPILYGGQFGAKQKIDDMKLTIGASYYTYSDIVNQSAFDYTGTFKTVTTTAGAPIQSYQGNSFDKKSGHYLNSFNIWEGFMDYSLNVFDLPVKAYASYVVNAGAAGQGLNRAWVYGVLLNKAAKEGSWEFGYDYRVVEKDAVVAAFNYSDFAGGGTDASGHELKAGYMVTDNVKLAACFLRDQKNIDTKLNPYYNRFQLDAVLSF